ncbi:glycosyltransferase family 4 protein [Hoeflea sp. YIM 152468]|uniref:glycosyltransferase family 4 protein n=1 Tax=Hoeflea sp. YIM 152468 TaxID=3031759 RepID=UPI0023DB3A91|nr:glycosyltransferase family 4 protein [Hoeflea sp. YIM 152468]MDF1610262.1 glycosyltransferase family 4 protein [Hoeflea sp. YIM 152468]
MADPRIVYFCLETPREGQASFTHVHEIIAGLRKSGFDVQLIATDRGGASSGASVLRRGWGYLKAHLDLFGVLRKTDAIYMRAHFAALPASLVARLLAKPVIQEINGRPTDILVTYPWLRLLTRALNFSYRLQLRLASQVIAVTAGLRDWAQQEAGHSRVSVVPNGANTEHFSLSGPGGSVQGSYVIFVGGLVAWHGLVTMLAAVKAPAWPKNVKLVVVGDGPERGLVAAETASGLVEWIGKQPYADIPGLLRGAVAALCVIGDPEGRSATGVAPLKLFEAMACGIPVIVSDLPFQAELVRTENAGLVVPIDDPAALAEAVAKLKDAPETAVAMGRAGADYVQRHASWLVRARETGRILTKALG